MDKKRFFELASFPEVITETDTALLSNVIKDYPYFHTAYLLLVYNLKALENENFNQALRDYALHVADRKVLFNLVNKAKPPRTELLNPIQQENSLTNDMVEIHLEESKPILQAEELEHTLDIDTPETTIELEEPLNLADDFQENPRVVEFDLASTPVTNTPDNSRDLIDDFLSFIESPKNDKPKEESNQATLIDKFITENPAFTPNKLTLSDQQEDISMNSIAEDEELVSETLAQVFESQKLFDKAIGIYEKLILKIPEKSTYFASRIEELRIKFK
jgi:hypothetical protein